MKILSRILTMLSAFGILGTIGAYDTESISLFQTAVQLFFCGAAGWTSLRFMKRPVPSALKRAFYPRPARKLRYSAPSPDVA